MGRTVADLDQRSGLLRIAITALLELLNPTPKGLAYVKVGKYHAVNVNPSCWDTYVYRWLSRMIKNKSSEPL